jgi:hypothetical protein
MTEYETGISETTLRWIAEKLILDRAAYIRDAEIVEHLRDYGLPQEEEERLTGVIHSLIENAKITIRFPNASKRNGGRP